MNSEKRLLLAVSISMLIIIAYQFYAKQYTGYGQPHKGPVVSAECVPDVPSSLGGDVTASEIKQVYETKTLVNNNLRVELTTDGARAIAVDLLDYFDKSGSAQPLIEHNLKAPSLFSITFLPDSAVARWDLVEASAISAVFKSRFSGVDITKTIILSQDSNQMEMVLRFANHAKHASTFQYQLYNGILAAGKGSMDSRYIGADICFDNQIIRRGISGKTLKGKESFFGSPAWVTTRGRYFSFIMKPKQPAQSVSVQSKTKNDLFTSVVSEPIALMPDSTIEHRFLVYAGPNDIQKMLLFDPSAHSIIHYGFFNVIGKILFDGLKILYHITHNYGIAIILLSLLISIIMFPLSRKSLQSMKEMQKIQPETEAIRKQFSDNPQKMNKEIMELYKRHKINPLGGCLPMLLQIPIFFSLYQVLLRSVELKGAGFLWIKDLAEPDAAFQLPTAVRSLPVIGTSVNILPILMALAMVFQQKLSCGGSKQLSEQQRIMAVIMPIMFGLIFYNMPSGLVLYWFTNTMFMLFLQEVILKLPAFASDKC
ncbi:MAG: membrane protein insertase YidC [Candidatus Omnitrophica bacterium]|nr:membrane protein insertase YidC [Candidatus Omnitrophota bacterium]